MPDKPGCFRTDGVGRDKDVDFVPFYRLHRRTYAVYWDLFTPADGAQVARVSGRPGRRTKDWFSFDLPVDKARPTALVVTYNHDEWRRRTFEIQIDGNRLAEQTIERRGPLRFFDVEYAVADKFIGGKSKVTVRFQATGGNETAAVFGIRTIRADAPR